MEQQRITLGERIKSHIARITLGTAFRVFNSLLENLVEVPFSHNALDRMLIGEKDVKILKFRRHVSLTGDRVRGIHVHIDFSRDFVRNHFSVREALGDVLELIEVLKNYQRAHKAPMKIMISSFWLRRKQIKKIFLDFVESQNILYKSLEDGGAGIYEYLIFFSMLPLEKFRSIFHTGIETGVIHIPGGKDPLLASFRDSNLTSEEMARIYNQHHGFRSSAKTVSFHTNAY